MDLTKLAKPIAAQTVAAASLLANANWATGWFAVSNAEEVHIDLAAASAQVMASVDVELSNDGATPVTAANATVVLNGVDTNPLSNGGTSFVARYNAAVKISIPWAYMRVVGTVAGFDIGAAMTASPTLINPATIQY